MACNICSVRADWIMELGRAPQRTAAAYCWRAASNGALRPARATLCAARNASWIPKASTTTGARSEAQPPKGQESAGLDRVQGYCGALDVAQTALQITQVGRVRQIVIAIAERGCSRTKEVGDAANDGAHDGFGSRLARVLGLTLIIGWRTVAASRTTSRAVAAQGLRGLPATDLPAVHADWSLVGGSNPCPLGENQMSLAARRTRLRFEQTAQRWAASRSSASSSSTGANPVCSTLKHRYRGSGLAPASTRLSCRCP